VIKKKRQFHRGMPNYPSDVRPLRGRMPKPHLIFHDGKWKLFRNWWKSAWSVLNPKNSAVYISGNTIAELRFHLKRCKDRRFGGGYD
jgi:hypothetical protein